MPLREPAGLFIQGTQERIPLTGVRIRVDGHGASARVTVSQRYVNTQTKPIEAVYTFPLEESSAVCGFTVETGGRRIVGKIEEKEKAFEQYDEAMAEGHGAFLVDQDRPNVFTASVGNLKAGQDATIEIVYAAELEQHGESVRVMIPTTVSPRYIPQKQLKAMDPAELDHLTPPTVIGAVPYGLAFELKYTAPQGVKSINCPSHPAEVELDGNAARMTLMGENVQLDRDVVVNITLARPHEAGAIVARDGDGTRALMLNFFPDLKQGVRGPSEFIFVVDRSGSMQGESITQARNALLLALRSMDEGDRFNVIGFGSRTEKLFEAPVAYGQKTLEEATQKLETWDANLGGTELLQPLQLVLEESGAGELPRQVMLLTDGQVGNEAECIALAGKHAGRARIFTFGIGYGASEHLVRGLARASGGQAEFIQANERIEPKVMRQFARAASPYLKNVRIDWGGLQTDLVAPQTLPPLFNGDRLTVYGRVIGGAGSEVAILAESSSGPIRLPLAVDLERSVEAPAVPVLMARRAIQELEDGEARGSNQENRKKKSTESRVLELALRYQLMSSQTSFIAIEERAAAEKTTERAELKRVPVALTKGWGGVGATHVGGFAVAKAAMPSVAARSAAVPGGLVLGAPAPAMPAREPMKRRKATGFFGKAREMLSGEGAPSQEPTVDASQAEDSDRFLLSYYKDAESCETSAPTDELLELTVLQHADGHFDIPYAPRLKVSGNALHEFEDMLEKYTSNAEFVSCTLLALVLLETRFASRRDEWQMLADKAERWLAKQNLTLPAGETSAKAWAKKVLGL